MDESFFRGIGILVFIIIVFFLCRELMCWYWKQNEIVSILKDIRHAVELQADIEEKTFISEFKKGYREELAEEKTLKEQENI